MKILFLSQMGFQGKISRNHENMRVEFAQMCALEADHSFIYNVDNIKNQYDVVITDLMMNDVDGMGILENATELLPHAEVIMVTGHATVPKAVEAMQLGAFNFLEKPIRKMATSRLLNEKK